MQNTSVVPAAEIGLDDAGIVANGLGRARLGGHAHGVEHGDLREDVGDLERLGQPAAVHALGRQPRYVLAAEAHRSRRRRVQPGDDVEQGGLARAVRPDHREHLAGLDAEADAGERGQRAEALGDVGDLEDHAAARPERHPKSWRSPSRPRGMKSTMTISTPPITMKYQSTTDETLSRRIVKNAPPMIGPTRVPRPPIMTEMMNSPDSVHSIRSGVAKAERMG